MGVLEDDDEDEDEGVDEEEEDNEVWFRERTDEGALGVGVGVEDEGVPMMPPRRLERPPIMF
jgi:hypothetical protein